MLPMRRGGGQSCNDAEVYIALELVRTAASKWSRPSWRTSRTLCKSSAPLRATVSVLRFK
jgi:hypothetical protein